MSHWVSGKKGGEGREGEERGGEKMYCTLQSTDHIHMHVRVLVYVLLCGCVLVQL